MSSYCGFHVASAAFRLAPLLVHPRGKTADAQLCPSHRGPGRLRDDPVTRPAGANTRPAFRAPAKDTPMLLQPTRSSTTAKARPCPQ